MKKKWIFKKTNLEAVALLQENLKISNLVATLLVNRGIETLEDAKYFLSGELKDLPSPFLLKDMKKACIRLAKAIEQHESIFIYGDYDVDGVTSTSNLVQFFRELGVEVGFHIPHRIKEGYGLHVDALKQIKERGGQVVITADCGISNVKEAIAATELGIDLIVTDHHIVPPKLPSAHAVLNPLRADSEYPDLYLSGVGVAFNLMMGLRSYLRDQGFFKKRSEPNLKSYMDLVALGTIADMVPLKGANHILVREGLKVLSSRQKPGIKALCDVSKIDESKKIGTYEVGFQLAPRLNAGGRIADAAKGVDLLTTDDFTEALEIAKSLDQQNSQRRLLQQTILTQALAQVEENKLQNKKSFVLSSESWHPGVIGIVASKLIEKYYRPTCMIGIKDGKGKGSCRSISGLNLFEALSQCKQYFESFGGHKAAAGFSIKEENIKAFSEKFEQVVSDMLTQEDFIPKINVDLKINLHDVDRALLKDLDKLAPYGMGNPEPVLMCENFTSVRSKIVGQKHLKAIFEDSQSQVDAIGFNMSEAHVDAHKIQSILFYPALNEWQGRTTVQLKLKDLLI